MEWLWIAVPVVLVVAMVVAMSRRGAEDPDHRHYDTRTQDNPGGPGQIGPIDGGGFAP